MSERRWVKITSKGRVKASPGAVAYVDGRRAWPWTRIELGRAYHLTTRPRRLFFR